MEQKNKNPLFLLQRAAILTHLSKNASYFTLGGSKVERGISFRKKVGVIYSIPAYQSGR